MAQAVNPACRVVYADNDPLVLAHARALLTSTPEGSIAYIHADRREPQALLSNRAVREILDFGQPIAPPRPTPQEVNGYAGVARKP